MLSRFRHHRSSSCGKSPSAGERFRIFRNDSLVGTTSRTGYTDTRLRAGTRYVYRVESLNRAGEVVRSSTVSLATPTKGSSPVYPLKVGPTRRYLVDQRNVPFMFVGDSPQALTVNLSVADAERFLANRRAAGFNAMWVNLLCIICTTLAGGRSDGTTYDGILPFTTPGDMSTPNEAYFARADRMIKLAQKYGIVLFLDPIETAGWLQVLRSNSVETAYGYGRYLGKRYGEFPNIIWFSGNDFQTWRNPERHGASSRRSHEASEMPTPGNSTPSSSTTRSAVPWTTRPGGRSSASTPSTRTHRRTQSSSRSTACDRHLPTVMVEANYEFEALALPGESRNLAPAGVLVDAERRLRAASTATGTRGSSSRDGKATWTRRARNR